MMVQAFPKVHLDPVALELPLLYTDVHTGELDILDRGSGCSWLGSWLVRRRQWVGGLLVGGPSLASAPIFIFGLRGHRNCSRRHWFGPRLQLLWLRLQFGQCDH